MPWETSIQIQDELNFVFLFIIGTLVTITYIFKKRNFFKYVLLFKRLKHRLKNDKESKTISSIQTGTFLVTEKKKKKSK